MKKPPVRQRRRRGTVACNPLHHNLRLVTCYLPTGQLKAPRRALRKHGKRQLSALKASITEFGILKSILVNSEGRIVTGYGVWLAAKELDMAEVPTICVTHLSPEQLRLYAITDNQISALEEPWDAEALRLELTELSELSLTLDLNLELTGLPTDQIEDILSPRPTANSEEGDEEGLTEVPAESVTRLGDVWLCGGHKLLCGNALEVETYEKLLSNERAQLVVVDSPYNMSLNDHVSLSDRSEELAMASDEISGAEVTVSLATAFGHLARYSIKGSIHFQLVQRRHMSDMLAAAEQTGRGARLIELDPHYCDVTVRRWERLTGEKAVLNRIGKTFAEVEAERLGETGQV